MVELRVREEAQAAAGHASSLPVDLVCTVCGYGIAARLVPPTCPMCRSEAWEPGAWRPFAARLGLFSTG